MNRRELSRRQKQVTIMVANGYTDGEIAKELNVSISTVKAHMHMNIAFIKMNARNRAELAYRYAKYEDKLVKADSELELQQ